MDSNKNNSEKSNKLIGKLADEWTESLWDRLVEKITKTESKNEVREILENLISSDEKKMMLRRLAILALVKEGKSYQEIGEILWVSPQTISSVKKNGFGSAGNYKSYRHFYGGPKKWSVVTVEKNFMDLLDNLNILELLKNPPRPREMGLKN